ncbi:ABC transporter permease, partial [Microbacterium sp. ISL-103]|uniref:ABC transporter permease n=1 Tax=Microbacterium sp. ISL-103 TaxID=2819156 RepID=UPI001BEBBB42
MLGYILRRLLQVIPVFFGATLLIYFLVFAMPGDPILALFGDKTPSPAVIEQLREQYHLNDPFIVQYWYYITGVFQGDLGTTYSGRPVSAVLAATLPVTGRLAVMAIAIEFVLAIIIGTISALR